MIQVYESALMRMRDRYAAGVGARDLLHKQLETKREDLEAARADIALWEQVQALLAKVSEFTREQVKTRIEETVTAALTAVFGEGLEFRVHMRTIGNQPAAEWQVISRYGDLEVAGEPESSHGGGVSDVISLALRLAIMELIRPRVEGPVLLDEAGKHVSSEFVSNVAYFLRQYAEKTGRQIILVTHQKALAEAAHVGYQVSQSQGVSVVSRLG